MEIATLDSNLQRADVIDEYESLIWTERWQDIGDFGLKLQSNEKHRELFKTGAMLTLPRKSLALMVVKTVEDKDESAEGKRVLLVKGQSLESIFMDRVYASYSGGGASVSLLSFTPGDMIRHIFNFVCRNGSSMSVLDIIPFLEEGYVPGGPPTFWIDEPSESITIRQEPDLVYNIFRRIGKAYDLGFRLQFYRSKLYFEVNPGYDRSSEQEPNFDPGMPDNKIIAFGPDLDNVEDFTNFKTIQDAKNVIYLKFNNGSKLVYGDGVSSSIPSFERRYAFHYAPDEDLDIPPDGTIDDALETFGKLELAKSRAFSIMDGQLDPRGTLKYMSDYTLGDKIDFVNRDGDRSIRRVTEHIYVSDAEGDRSFPTLSIGEY